jgi:purine nucleosidase
MVRPAVEASHFHGTSGLGWLEVFEPRVPLAELHAVRFIVDTLLREPPRSVSLLITGPMTNVAMAMVLEPAIIPRIAEVIFMGGARLEGGNITASAEYNIYADPHAAQVVCTADCQRIALGLDVTHQVRATAERIERIRRVGNEAAAAAASLLEFCNSLEANIARGAGSPLHDPCTVAYAIQPELFAMRPAHLRVETASELTLGHTAIEFRAEMGLPLSTQWAISADADGIFDLLTHHLERL